MAMLSHRFGVAVVLSLFALGGCGGGSGKGANSALHNQSSGEGSGGSGHAEVGKPAPDLSIQSLNGKGKISLESLQGKIVIVDFWATWCGPCKQSFPKLEELSKKVGDKVEIVGISVDDDKKGVAEFAKENGATFAIGWDDGHTIAEKWKVGTMPTTFIVDASGKVRFIHDGYHDGETKLMEKELAQLAEEPSDTRVAKNEKSESKSESEPKSEAKPEKSEKSEKTEKTASAEPEEAEPPPPPKKKAGKKGGRAGGKAAPPKKHKKK